MLTLEYGRPADADSRLPKEKRTYDFLDALGVEYARVDHDSADTMEACEEIDKIFDDLSAKVLNISGVTWSVAT